MRSVSKRQKAHDPEAVCSVTSFTARPLLRVGGKDKGTRFLSFVDAMIGFRHLLTEEDLNKAASLCTSMKGTLQSKFLVLSDDKVLPPPPNPKRKRTLSGSQDQGQPAKSSRPGGSSQNAKKQLHSASGVNSQASKVSKSQPSDPGTSTGPDLSAWTQAGRKKRLPAGVSPIPTRTTPVRAAKEKGSKATKSKSKTNDEPVTEDGDDPDEVMSESGSGSGSEEEAGSDQTVVDWVFINSSFFMSLMVILLIPFSTVPSLSITDFSSLFWCRMGRSIARRRLITSQWIVRVVLS